MASVRRTAKELGLCASILATRKDVTQLVRGRRDASLLNGWRRHVIGEDLLELAS